MKKFLTASSVFAILAGIILVIGGIWSICFIYQNVASENIVTPKDAELFPETRVRGPVTLKSQADTIRKHTLESSDGKTYAEMPRQIAQLDASGNPVLDGEGQPVMVANEARNIWVTALTLITTLHLAIIAYVFSGFIVLVGIISLWTGIVFAVFHRQGIIKPKARRKAKSGDF